MPRRKAVVKQAMAKQMHIFKDSWRAWHFKRALDDLGDKAGKGQRQKRSQAQPEMKQHQHRYEQNHHHAIAKTSPNTDNTISPRAVEAIDKQEKLMIPQQCRDKKGDKE